MNGRPLRLVGSPFAHALELAGWSGRSVWGFDPDLECYWAELWRADSDSAPVIRVGVEHLITTVEGLAGAMSQLGRLPSSVAYLALTA